VSLSLRACCGESRGYHGGQRRSTWAALRVHFVGLPRGRFIRGRFEDQQLHDCFVTVDNAFGCMHELASKDSFPNSRNHYRRPRHRIEEALGASRSMVVDDNKPMLVQRADVIASARSFGEITFPYPLLTRNSSPHGVNACMNSPQHIEKHCSDGNLS
jgi:hypothetical protein